MPRLQLPPHDLVIDEARFLILLAGSLSLTPLEKQHLFASVPAMTQERYDRLIGILESEKTQIDALSRRREHIRRFIGAARIEAAREISTQNEMNELCERYDGFYRFAQFMEEFARGLADGSIPRMP